MNPARNPYRAFRFSRSRHAVWLYYCFSLSLRGVESILAERGIVVNYESLRNWSFPLRSDLRDLESPPAAAGRGIHNWTLREAFALSLRR